MITLSVTATLARAAALDGPVHLDAVLAARHPAMHDQEFTLARTDGRPTVAPLPLVRVRAGKTWVWCASAWSPPADGVSALTKRREGGDYLLTQRVVYPSVGPDRDRLKRFTTSRGPLQFYACVPDERGVREVKRLLRRISQVGGMRKSGYGVVAEWSVEVIDADPLICLIDGDGLSRRALPASMLEADAPAELMSIIPPYWQTGEVHMSHPPKTPGRLCDKIRLTSANSSRSSTQSG